MDPPPSSSNMRGVVALISLCLIPCASARWITVRNACDFTIWPAMFTTPPKTDNGTAAAPANGTVQTPADGTAQPSGNGTAVQRRDYKSAFPTGWMAKPMTEVHFEVPETWTSGRIWGRTDCDFSKDTGPLTCKTGGCNGGLKCDLLAGTGVPPATVAEWTLHGGEDSDWYDVSLVDGFNLPMSVVPTKASDSRPPSSFKPDPNGCTVADCVTDINAICPAKLQGPKNAKGKLVGCNSGCNAKLDPDPENSPNCCTGRHNTEKTCPKENVFHYKIFKTACKNSYAYAYDEPSQTALWKCPWKKSPNYVLTFCPASKVKSKL